MSWFDVMYTVVQNEDGSYEWKRLTGKGVGAPPYEGLPRRSTKEGASGVVNAYSKDDHVHPHDVIKQDDLWDNDGNPLIPMRTINGERWWNTNGDIYGVGEIQIEDGVNKIEKISVNDTEFPPVDKIVNIPVKTINGESIYGEGNIEIPLDFKPIHFGERVQYDYTKEVNVGIYDGSFRRV